MRRRRRDALIGAIFVFDLTFLPFVAPAWFTSTLALLIAVWAVLVAQSYWYRGEIYRLGGVPHGETRSAEERAALLGYLMNSGPHRSLTIPVAEPEPPAP